MLQSLESVLIESDWNLKKERRKTRSDTRSVLIESDWNLKKFYYLVCPVEYDRINRIRLEFKVDVTSDNARMIVVLIESDWNLKMNK